MANKETTGNESLGAILGGMISFDQSISNRLMADGWGTAEVWAIRYAELVEDIERVNNDLRVDRVLSNSYPAWDARERAEHYRSMAEKFESGE